MAILRHVATNITHRLDSECLVGRGPQCSLQLGHRGASSQHASIRWNGQEWRLHDLNSKNGTFVDGERISTAVRPRLQVGQRLAFGAEDDIFEVVDASPPQVRARCEEDGRERLGEDGLLVLPGAERPEVTIHATQDSWLAEWNDGRQEPIESGGSLAIDGVHWRILLPTVSPVTLARENMQWSLQRLTLRFQVSADEETVSLELAQAGQTIELGAKAHNYLLVTLARNRIADQRAGQLSETECGWMDTPGLIHSLRMTENQFNVSVWRARKDLAGAGIPGATGLIERRTRARQIRIGVERLQVEQ